MAITIDHNSRVINVPQADLTFVSGTLWELDVDAFRLTLKGLEDDADGMVLPDTHRHNTEVSLAGVTFARTVEIINGYTVTFEDGNYRVRLVGANNNIADVTNLNGVSILSQNSGGLIVTAGGGVTQDDKTEIAGLVWDEAAADHVAAGTLGKAISDVKGATHAPTIVRGEEFGLAFSMIDSNGDLAEGLTVSAMVGQDGGSMAATTNSVTEVGGGVYHVTLTAAEMTADMVALRFTAAGARPQALSVATYKEALA